MKNINDRLHELMACEIERQQKDLHDMMRFTMQVCERAIKEACEELRYSGYDVSDPYFVDYFFWEYHKGVRFSAEELSKRELIK